MARGSGGESGGREKVGEMHPSFGGSKESATLGVWRGRTSDVTSLSIPWIFSWNIPPLQVLGHLYSLPHATLFRSLEMPLTARSWGSRSAGEPAEAAV